MGVYENFGFVVCMYVCTFEAHIVIPDQTVCDVKQLSVLDGKNVMAKNLCHHLESQS